MNLWKIICEAFGKNWRCCDAYWDTVPLCRASGKLARSECPEKEEKRLKKRDVPKETCSIHLPVPPPPLPKWKICKETGREATPWCPETETIFEEPTLACRRHRPPRPAEIPHFVIFSIYPHCKVDETDEELDEFAHRFGAAGWSYGRFFSGWREDPGFVMPFLHSEDGIKWDVFKVNPEYIRALQRFQKKWAKAGMGIIFDAFPSQLCRAGYPFAFWHRDNNVNDIDSIYDVKPHAIAHFCSWIKTIFDAIGTEGNLLALGNEMQAPGDYLDITDQHNDVNEIKRWAEKWIDPIGQFVQALGIEMPIGCTCEPYRGTGHKISNYLCEEGWGFTWPWENVVNHIHCGTLAGWNAWWVPNGERRYSVRKHYLISDDGIGFDDLNSVPIDQRGTCSKGREWYGGYVGPKCSGNVAYRTEWVRHFKNVFQERLRFVELMNQCHHNETYRLNDVDQEVDVDISWKVTLELYGIDIRRNL